ILLEKTAPDHGKFDRPLLTEFKDTQASHVSINSSLLTEFCEQGISSGQQQVSMQNSGCNK
ncbi:MAG: hypothetical protein ONB49_04010, partial [candidate division KSB1 bacterium]|nr:hypothetical protein [candidate division KSB1 bacterium]